MADAEAPFLAAQAASPFDPAPMLIWADHQEESGDLVASDVLRGLTRAGIPSLHALAIDATLVSMSWRPDQFGLMGSRGDEGYGGGDGNGPDNLERFLVDRGG